MSKHLKFIISFVLTIIEVKTVNTNVLTTKTFMFWPNATIPFFINPEHFDYEQSLAIMTALSQFTYKSCLKFAPVMAAPEGNQHVMVFENPDAVRRCKIVTTGHSTFETHSVILGYECLQSPHIDMIIMKALGFPFEHNRASRDVYIEVLVENIEPGSIELYTKETVLPMELRTLPYDINSVMHFGERDYSKNGHRTIIFKDRNVVQNRVSLTPIDLRKIEIVYGEECRKRDRQEKIELCQSYPGIARKKREVNAEQKSLRVNPDITPPQTIENAIITEAPIIKETRDTLKDSFKELGIVDEVQVILEHVHKVSALAVNNAKHKYCNATQKESKTDTEENKKNSTDLLRVIEVVADYAKSVVDHAISNLTMFCEASENVDLYQMQRQGCRWDDNSDRCRPTYKSTKSGPVRYSTQHRPVYIQSTKHDGHGKRIQYGRMLSLNEFEMTTEAAGSVKDTIVHEEANLRVTDQNLIKVDVVTENLDAVVQKTMVNNDKVPADTIKTTKENDAKTAEHSRRKREVSETDAVNTGLEALNSSESVQDHVDVTKGNVSENASDVTTTASGFDKVQVGKQQPRQSRRYKIKKPKRKVNKDWDESSMSLEQNKGVDNKVKVQQTNEEIKEKEIENSKRKEERLLNKESVLKKRLINKRAKVEPKKRFRTPTPRTVSLSKLNKEFYDERKWTNGIVPYVIAENPVYDIEDLRSRIAEVSAILRRKTCVKLTELTEDQAKEHEDYLVIDTSPDYVTGKVGGRQNFGSIELFRGGQHRQHTAMMVMAMLGFYFEVARHDRDKYIRVHMRHVRPDKLHHFEKIRDEATLPLPYDYKSATHPAWQFWRKIGKTGISTVATFKENDADGSVMRSLGQNEELLSETDLVKINSVYGVKCFRNSRGRARKPEDKD